MKTFLIYLAGVATPFACAFLFFCIGEYFDWQDRRRYQRAWDKFGKEFDSPCRGTLTAYQAQWKAEPWRFDRYADDRSRYFEMRWKHGQATDV